MNQGGPSTRACYLLCCLPQRVLRALAHRQQGYLNCVVLVLKPHLQKPTRPIVGKKKNTSSVIKEGWECGREPLASVAASYKIWFEIPPWEKEIIQNGREGEKWEGGRKREGERELVSGLLEKREGEKRESW